jgi:hypothetical protein
MVESRKRTRLGALTLAVVGVLASCLLFGQVQAAVAAPVWDVSARWGPTVLPPGGKGQLVLQVRNLGDAPSAGAVTVTQTLPLGVTRAAPTPLDKLVDPARPGSGQILFEGEGWTCAGTTTVTCARTGSVPQRAAVLSGYAPKIFISLNISAAAAVGIYPILSTVSSSDPGAVPGTDAESIEIGTAPLGFGFVPDSFRANIFDGQYPAGLPVEQAASHPFEMRVDFDQTLLYGENPPNPGPGPVSPHRFTRLVGDLRTVVTTLPRGLAGNPEAVPKCTAVDFLESRGFTETACPPETQVGTIDIELGAPTTADPGGFGSQFLPGISSGIPIYNLVPPKGEVADFGFRVFAYGGHILPTLDPGSGYAIVSTSPFVSNAFPVREVRATFWGVPADPAHDNLRFDPETGKFGVSVDGPFEPFLTSSADCGFAGRFSQVADSWQAPEEFTSPVQSADDVKVSGCEDPRLRFEPEVALQPTSRAASGPTGLRVNLEVPQRENSVADAKELYAESGDMNAIDTPPMKKAVVTLPEGMTLSTSAAQGLGGCSAEQIGIGTDSPVSCPESSRYGALTIRTPILPKDEPMQGDIYIAKQKENPFGSFLAMYFVIHDESRGLLVKLPGRIDLDPQTGQIKTTFDDLPQFPVSDMELSLKGGVRAGLVNPTTCGTKKIRAEFFSWHDPETPIVEESSYEIANKGDGSPCVNSLAERPFSPELEAGTLNPNAGSYSPFVFRLQRSDDDQEFSQLSTTLPPGLLANISELTECPEAGIAQALAPGRTGTAEELFPSCPASSQLGTTDVGSGVGQVITYVPGKAYLAGPYRGAPLSMVVITPILAGPYDLGVITVRSAIHVNGERAQATISTDPFPQIFEGIPVRIRDIRVKADVPETIINPTSCDPMAVSARVTGTGGNLDSTADDTAVELAERFQAANCASLPFKPKLTFKLKGTTRRGGFPAFSALLRARPGEANIARSQVLLPKSTFIAQSHIDTVCTRVQFAADTCPAGSIYGKARALSPLFDETLSGPVYLRANGGQRLLPDLVVKLDGKIEVVLTGFVDSVNERVRNTFDVVPDAPVTYFALEMLGGRKGLLQNSENLCRSSSKANVRLTAQNGKHHIFRTRLKATACGKEAARKGKGRAKR